MTLFRHIEQSDTSKILHCVQDDVDVSCWAERNILKTSKILRFTQDDIYSVILSKAKHLMIHEDSSLRSEWRFFSIKILRFTQNEIKKTDSPLWNENIIGKSDFLFFFFSYFVCKNAQYPFWDSYRSAFEIASWGACILRTGTPQSTTSIP